jgi:RNA-directed DNA polymerase
MRDTPRSPIIGQTLEQIAKRARSYPQTVFTTLCHRIDVAMLTEAFYLLKRNSAAGIDRVTWRQYKKELDANLSDLHQRLKDGTYRAQLSRRVWLEKENGKKRPIAIAVLEDKIVERAEVMLLEAVYEGDFYPFSFAFRKGRNQHHALKYFRDICMESNECWMVDVDLKGYFDSISQALCIDVLKKRVNDGGLLRLINQHLKAGVIDKGSVEYSETGVPQGGVVSPILSNIFLHHVVDTWFEKEVRPALAGRGAMVRYADDIMVKCNSESDARMVLEKLKTRLAEYELTVNAEKTRLVRFCKPTDDRQAKETPAVDFLGFTHYWGKTRNGGWTIKRRTMGKRLRRAKTNIWQWSKEHRHSKLSVQHAVLSAKLRGHYNYYGVRCNYEQMQSLYHFTECTWLRWLRRRSSKHRLNWKKFAEKILKTFPLPKPKIILSWV